jgi:thiamine biosynthesis lipoprotein
MMAQNNSEWGWHGLCFRAMNTQVETQLYTNTDAAALLEVQRMFRKAEQTMTRFDPRSELCQLNQSAGQAQRVSSLLFDTVEMAVWAALATDGLFDPTLLRWMEAIGYDRSFEKIAQSGPLASLPPAPGRERYARIELNRPRREIYLPPEVQIDLGGIGKGWTADRAADWLAGRGPFLINAGGDLYAYGAPPGQTGWSIGIVDPWQPTRHITRLSVRQRAVATSTISRRRWMRGDQAMHHLIDPRTGQPAVTDAVSVTVVAQRVVMAEVYAKAALILGVEAGRDWLNRTPAVEGLLVRDDGQLIMTNGFSAYLEVAHDLTITSQSYHLPPGRPVDFRRRHDHWRSHRLAGAGAG